MFSVMCETSVVMHSSIPVQLVTELLQAMKTLRWQPRGNGQWSFRLLVQEEEVLGGETTALTLRVNCLANSNKPFG